MGNLLDTITTAPDKFFSTDLDQYSSFWDWLLRIYNPLDKDIGIYYNHTSYLTNELEFYLMAILTFMHAYRHGGRYIWLWFAIMLHGFTVELVSYWIEPIDNFYHGQGTFMWFGRREPFQIILVYPAYLYIAATVVHRMGVSELTEAPILGLMVVIFDIPYDIMGIKLLW